MPRLSFSLSYPTWFVILCPLVGFLYAFFLYQKKKSAFPSTLLYWLVFAFRFFTTTVLTFLLLSPILKYLKHKEEKPGIVFIQDNSGSEKFAFRKIDSVAYRKSVIQLLNDLREEYNVKEYTIGDNLKDTLRFQYNETATDISSALETVYTSLENENIGAVILASDGIYNKGVSPLHVSYPFKGTMYTVGLGDTTIQRDAFIARVFANRVVYLGDPFAIRTDAAAFSCTGSVVTVTVFNHNSNRVVSSQQVKVMNDHFSKSIETIIPTNVAGVQHYTISISKVEGEQNVVNNSQELFVEVLDSKESVLIVANAPHPDVFALKEALSKNKNYKVDVRMAQKMDANISNYNLIVLHNIPSVVYNGSTIVDQAKRLGISLWYIVGAQTALPVFNQTQTALQVTARGAGMADAQAIPNSEFSYFTQTLTPAIGNLPPLSIPFAEYKTGMNAQVLLIQRLGSVSTTYPLWVLQQTPNQRIGVTAGEGIWRWRLYNYEQYKNFNQVDDCILKTAQYLSVKRDKKQFRTTMPKSVYTESEPVSFDAELYNENYELVNTPDVQLTLLDEKNQKKSYTLNKEGSSYTLNIGNLAAGKYSYVTNTSHNGKAYSASGTFNVIAQNIEEINTTADFGLLNQLAKNYGGEFVFSKDIVSLKEKIKNNKNIKTLIRSDVNTEALIHWKWLFALLALLLSAEWFIRKRSGNY